MEAKNVTFGKPKVGGAIYSAPAGTELPSDATAELAEEFKELGYVSEDGVANANTTEVETVKAWGGDAVATSSSEHTDEWTLTLIEVMNLDVLKEAYGPDNVEGDSLETGITIKANGQEKPEHVIVIDMIYNGQVASRNVIPHAKVTNVDEISYTDTDIAGFPLTISGFPDKNGQTHYQYLKKITE